MKKTETAMNRCFRFTAVAAVMACSGLSAATAQQAVPRGHRQPTAASAPNDDSLLGTSTSSEARSSNAAKAKRKRKANPNVGFPDICSNCNR
jgi:hypothetical protein